MSRGNAQVWWLLLPSAVVAGAALFCYFQSRSHVDIPEAERIGADPAPDLKCPNPHR